MDTKAGSQFGVSVGRLIQKVRCLHQRGSLNSEQKYKLEIAFREGNDLELSAPDIKNRLKEFPENVQGLFEEFTSSGQAVA